MPESTTEPTSESVYKICTPNCTQYDFNGTNICKKGKFASEAPIGERCTLGLLEGEMEVEQSSPKCTESILPEQVRKGFMGEPVLVDARTGEEYLPGYHPDD